MSEEEYQELYCRIHDYVTCELEGDATPQQRDEFAELLRGNKEARTIYVKCIQEVTCLRWSFSNNPAELLYHAGNEPTLSSIASLGGLDAPHSKQGTLKRTIAKGLQAWLPLVLAASLLLGVGWFVSQSEQLSSQGEMAELASAAGWVFELKGVEWSPGEREYTELSQIEYGQPIVFESGKMTLMLNSGAEVDLEGPAHFCLISSKKACVEQGKLVARCGPDAIGFEIESPDATVVDLGTVFGVSVVDTNRTDVVVYDGAVDLSSRNGNKPLVRTLTAGEALHVSRHGEVGRIPLLPNDRLLMPRKLLQQSGKNDGFIRAVRDNLHSSETAKYYRIVSNGFNEDCPAFVDRDHCWNGLDMHGLPPFLVGGDYVMTFNDDKVRRVELELELAAPASVYLLLDNRIPPPEWLTREFLDTGWDIGLDEDYDDREHISSGIGPGESIDQVFSVWRRDYQKQGIAKIGPIRQENIDVNPRDLQECMYGIVVTGIVDTPQEVTY